MTEEKMCVYVCEMENGTVKIGITSDFERRKREIYNHSGMQILKSCRTEFMPAKEARNLESELHEIFAQSRKGGEFFAVDYMDAASEFGKKSIPLVEDYSDGRNERQMDLLDKIRRNFYIAHYAEEAILQINDDYLLRAMHKLEKSCSQETHKDLAEYIDELSEYIAKISVRVDNAIEKMNFEIFDNYEWIAQTLDLFIIIFKDEGRKAAFPIMYELYRQFLKIADEKLHATIQEKEDEVLKFIEDYVAELNKTQKKGHHLLNGSFYKKCDGTKMRENEVKKFREEVDRGIDILKF